MSTKKDSTKIKLMVYMPPALYQRFRREVFKRDTKRSELVCEAVKKLLDTKNDVHTDDANSCDKP